MARMYPYIFTKNAKETIETYKDVFGAKVVDWMPYSEQSKPPFDLPKNFDYANSTLHAVVDILGITFAIGDNLSNAPDQGNVDIVIEVDSKADIERITQKARDKGFKFRMELQRTFWGALYAMFHDADGVGWHLNFQEQPPPKNVQNEPKPVKKTVAKKTKK